MGGCGRSRLRPKSLSSGLVGSTAGKLCPDFLLSGHVWQKQSSEEAPWATAGLPDLYSSCRELGCTLSSEVP